MAAASNISASLSSLENETMKAIEEINSGDGIVCNSFEDYLKAVQCVTISNIKYGT
ncbi:MAG: hypothetical protein II670_00545 [Alphaproteobacteria bacterium]|nr:hypothetical protein [Alphaproteobacteria bacterium]